MIKITKYFYVHILTLVLFAVCIFIHRFTDVAVIYAVMFIHEMAHLVAALAIGLRVGHITFYPFGVNLKLKNKMVCSIADEIILYASGPCVNAIFAVFAMIVYRRFHVYALQYFYIANTMLFIVNLLPAVPLDGGVILKKILAHKYGIKTAEKVMRFISIILSAGLILLGIYIVYITKYNFSLILMSVLIIGNLFTQKEKYCVDYVKELMFYKDKSRKKVSVKVADINKSPHEISKSFDFGKYNIVFCTDSHGKIKNIVTETEIIDKILNKY